MQHKLGVHWIKTHGRPEDLDYVRRLQPLSVKLVAGDVPDVQWVSDTYQAAPHALLVLRSHAMSEQKQDVVDNPAGTGERHANEWRQHVDKLRQQAQQRGLPFPQDSQLCVLGINEPKLDAPGSLPVDQRMADMRNYAMQTDAYTVSFLNRLRALGLTGGALNLSVGWPTNWDLDGHPRPDNPPDWTLFENTHAAIVHGNHYLFIHEYHDIAGPSENWRWWCGRYLQCPWADVRIIIGEYGIDRYVKDDKVDINRRGWRGWLSADMYAAQIKEYHETVLRDSRIHSVQVYSSDFSHPWDSFDLPDVYPQLLGYANEVTQRPQPQSWVGYVIASPYLRLRAEPNITANVLANVELGEQVTVSGESGGWLQVTYGALSGWMAAQWVSQQPPAEHNVYIPIVSADGPTVPQSDFDRAMAFVLRWEGGLADNPADPGGLTNYGISQAAYPNLDIRNLTKDQAIEIYRRDYWQASGADALPWPLSLIHMDSAVNAGVGKAQQWLQQSNGNATAYMALRLEFYTKLKTWQSFGAAWARRVADLMKEAQ